MQFMQPPRKFSVLRSINGAVVMSKQPRKILMYFKVRSNVTIKLDVRARLDH